MSKLLTDNLNNTYRSLLRGMGIWDKNFFKDLFPALLQNKTGIMSKLTLDKNKKAKKVCSRNSHFFAKENFAKLPEKVEKRCFGLLGEIKNEDYICMDEVDIAKPSAKLMEGIAKVRDGSTGNIVNGFIFHGVSIKNIPVIIQQEDLTNKFKAEYFSIIIERMIKYTKSKGIYVLDTLYNIASYLDFLNNKGVKYIIRAKKNRWYFDVKSNKKLKLKEFTDGTYEVKIVAIIQLAVALSSSIYKVTSDFKGTTFFGCGKIFTTRFKKYTRH